MIKVLFVCTGNICRSPLAEGILRKKFNEHGIQGYTDSCGFESFHVGDSPDHRAQKVASKYGIDISGHRARLFSTHDFDRFDNIFVMDRTHFAQVLRQARNNDDREKVDYILNVAFPGRNEEVMDPWYHDIKAFESVYKQLENACSILVQKFI